MDDRITDLYKLPDISEYEDIHLQTLFEHCSVLEAQVYDILTRISDRDRQILEAYMDMRNELEYEAAHGVISVDKSVPVRIVSIIEKQK